MDQALRQYLSEAFYSSSNSESSFDADVVRNLIRDGVKDFQQHAKREFVSYEQEVSVQVAWRNVNDVSLDITHGVMRIPGYVLSIVGHSLVTVADRDSSLNSKTVRAFFSLCVDHMVDSLRTQLRAPGITVSCNQFTRPFRQLTEMIVSSLAHHTYWGPRRESAC